VSKRRLGIFYQGEDQAGGLQAVKNIVFDRTTIAFAACMFSAIEYPATDALSQSWTPVRATADSALQHPVVVIPIYD